MKLLLTLPLLFITIVSFSQQTIYGNITHDNILRSYILYVPDIYSSNNDAPLVFNFHGYTSDAYSQMLYGDFRDIADTAGFLIVHPQGTLDFGGSTHFNVGWGGSFVDDIGFANKLLETISNEYNIDLNKVYSTGMSNGGYMSYSLACQLSDKIAAIASVTGAMTSYQYLNCNPQNTIPIMQIHGDNDLIVPYNGSSFSLSIDNIINYWVTHNNCNSTPAINILPDIITNDLSTVNHIIYNDCNNSITNELFLIYNGGHTWPGNPFFKSETNYDINASVEIWKFFSKYDINGLITPISILESNKEDYPSLIKIIDYFGREVKENKNQILFYIYDDGSVEKRLKL